MLVLSFRTGEFAEMHFPDGSVGRVQIVRCSKTGRVRLGFANMPDVVVVRSSIATAPPAAACEASTE